VADHGHLGSMMLIVLGSLAIMIFGAAFQLTALKEQKIIRAYVKP
jgi:hypothetical protein